MKNLISQAQRNHIFGLCKKLNLETEDRYNITSSVTCNRTDSLKYEGEKTITYREAVILIQTLEKMLKKTSPRKKPISRAKRNCLVVFHRIADLQPEAAWRHKGSSRLNFASLDTYCLKRKVFAKKFNELNEKQYLHLLTILNAMLNNIRKSGDRSRET